MLPLPCPLLRLPIPSPLMAFLRRRYRPYRPPPANKRLSQNMLFQSVKLPFLRWQRTPAATIAARWAKCPASVCLPAPKGPGYRGLQTSGDGDHAMDGFNATERLSLSISSGEKAKARDILAAIRTLHAIEKEQRPATQDERQALSRFGGFGPVALSIFPDPVTGRYKDGWQTLGEELRTLLTPEEFASAKRTTFNAFYTSPAVIEAMYEGLARLGVPGNSTVLEPGCGPGRFLSLAARRHALRRRRIGLDLRPHRPRPSPRRRTYASKISATRSFLKAASTP